MTAGALTLTDQLQSLPGGVSLSRKPTTGVVRYALANVHGDLLAVDDQTGCRRRTTRPVERRIREQLAQFIKRG